MSDALLSPTLTALTDLHTVMREQGFVVLGADTVARGAGLDPAALLAWNPRWNDLPADQYLRDGGRYRRRRHASFRLETDGLHTVPYRPHWQPVSYNALHGGLQRWFDPMPEAWLLEPAWQSLMNWLAGIASVQQGPRTWFAESHVFRIDTTDGIGRPTPEGAHRDGVNFVAVFLVGRHQIKGGETRVFDVNSPQGQRFTLTEPWSLLLLDDQRVIHETTPIQPLVGTGWRDTLVVTLRADGFLDAPSGMVPAGPAR